MRIRLVSYWESLRSTYWFLPSLLALLAILLAWATIELDTYFLEERANGLQWLYAGKAEGALSLLSTVAGSMITVAGVTFSITIVALTLASSQFGPRLLNNFMRDRGNQLVLGTFIATFIFCLLVMRTIRSTTVDPFVPPISVTTGLLLAIASLGVLIYFIHHISTSINVEYVIANVEEDLNATIDRLYPQQRSPYAFEQVLRHEDDIPEDFASEARAVHAANNGYVQVIDYDTLVDISTEHDIVLRLEQRPGGFVAEGHALVLVRPGEVVDDELVEEINNAFIVGQRRLQRQDVTYDINQLVEIAVRALSPGINDPFTAIACLDRLGGALSNLAARATPSSYYYDDEDNLRVIGQSVTYGELVDTAFDQIRQYGRTSVGVTIRLLETIAVIAAHVQTDDQRAALRRHATMVRHGASTGVLEAMDRRVIEKQYQLALTMLNGSQA